MRVVCPGTKGYEEELTSLCERVFNGVGSAVLDQYTELLRSEWISQFVMKKQE